MRLTRSAVLVEKVGGSGAMRRLKKNQLRSPAAPFTYVIGLCIFIVICLYNESDMRDHNIFDSVPRGGVENIKICPIVLYAPYS